MPRRHFLENRIPPPIVAAGIAALMTLAARRLPGLALPFAGQVIAGWVITGIGVASAVAGAITFRGHHTTTNPLKPESASTLVEAGIYRRTRNPMYVGVTLVLAGYGVGLGHPVALALTALFPAYIQRFQIGPEERALNQIFGEAYAAYQSRVPRWL